MSDADLWKNRELADAKIKEIGELNELIKKFDGIEKMISEATACLSMGTGGLRSPADRSRLRSRHSDSSLSLGDQAPNASESCPTTNKQSPANIFQEKIGLVETKLRQLEIENLFTGKYDKGSATISIYAGAGGQDAEDWAGMLMEMYLKFADKRGWQTKIIDESLGNFQSKTGRKPLKSAVLEISAKGGSASGGKRDYVYGYLKKEAGVHRLVRISPFSQEKKRHTSFALIEILPEFKGSTEKSEMKIPEEDLKIEFSRSSGPGGQNVNKVETAVRIVHLPTGISTGSQVERSQSQNRERAMKLLQAKLFKLMEENQVKEVNKLKVKVKPEWGSQIRSYVLQPYQLVKDHRTGVETSQVDKVLEGDLDLFVENDIMESTNNESVRINE